MFKNTLFGGGGGWTVLFVPLRIVDFQISRSDGKQSAPRQKTNTAHTHIAVERQRRRVRHELELSRPRGVVSTRRGTLSGAQRNRFVVGPRTRFPAAAINPLVVVVLFSPTRLHASIFRKQTKRSYRAHSNCTRFHAHYRRVCLRTPY